MSNWKKTTEEKPNDGDMVVIIMKNCDYDMYGTYCDGTDIVTVETEDYRHTYDFEDVVAWCPIPKYDLEE